MEQKTWHKSMTVAEALGNATRGIFDAGRREWKLKIALACAVAALLMSYLLRLSSAEVGLVIFISASVIAAEMINSALETVLDSMFPQYHKGVRQAKDLAAGAVLTLSVAAALAGLLLFLPPVIQLIFE